MMAGRIAQISVSPGGVPKRPVEAARAGARGVEGSRVYARVLREGEIRRGDEVRVVTAD